MNPLLIASMLSALFTSTLASAADGRYQGTGILEVQGMNSRHCERVLLDVMDDPWGLYIRQFEYECEGVRGEMDPHRFEYRGSDVYFNGERVGQRYPGETRIQLRDPSSGAVLGLNFRDYSFQAVEVVQELSSHSMNQRMRANLTRY